MMDVICTNKTSVMMKNAIKQGLKIIIIKITRLSSGENPVKLVSLCDKFQDALTSSVS